MKAVLLQDTVQSEGPSMARYANELYSGLRALNPPDWQFEKVSCNQIDLVAKLIPGQLGSTLAERAARFVKYPLKASTLIGDVFHVLDHGHANIAAGLNPSRTIITCHDLISLLSQTGEIDMATPTWHSVTNLLRMHELKRARHIIAISANTKRDLIKHLHIPEERVTVVYLGVSPSFVAGAADQRLAARQAILEKWSLPENCKIILNVSIAARYKNIQAIIRALSVLNKEFDNNVFFVRVSGQLLDEEKELVSKLGLEDRVISTGWATSDAQLKAYYWAADVLVFPSFWEGFGWPPLEALACGTPVVASNVASLPEAVGDGGLLIDPRSPDELAAAVGKILRDESLRNRLRAAGLAHASSFTWKRSASQTLEIYEKIAQGKVAR